MHARSRGKISSRVPNILLALWPRRHLRPRNAEDARNPFLYRWRKTHLRAKTSSARRFTSSHFTFCMNASMYFAAAAP